MEESLILWSSRFACFQERANTCCSTKTVHHIKKGNGSKLERDVLASFFINYWFNITNFVEQVCLDLNNIIFCTKKAKQSLHGTVIFQTLLQINQLFFLFLDEISGIAALIFLLFWMHTLKICDSFCFDRALTRCFQVPLDVLPKAASISSNHVFTCTLLWEAIVLWTAIKLALFWWGSALQKKFGRSIDQICGNGEWDWFFVQSFLFFECPWSSLFALNWVQSQILRSF